MFLKKHIYIIFLLLLVFPTITYASERSSDTMILEWKTYKVWKDDEDLCITGEFENLRDDLKITKLNNFTAIITFKDNDGNSYQYIGKPEKLPICKIAPNSKKHITFNLGKFDGIWSSWNVETMYNFSYINGVSF